MNADTVNASIVLLFLVGVVLTALGIPRSKDRNINPRITVDRSVFDPSVLNNIRHQIVPYVISASMLPKTAEYTAYRFYSYVRAFMAAIVGIGIAPPIWSYLSNVANEGQDATKASIVAPAGLGYAAFTCAILLVAFSVYSTQTSLDKRAVLADSCSSEFRAHYAKLLSMVSASNLSSKLDDLSNEIATNVQRHIAEKSWTWPDVIAPGINLRADELTDSILAQIKQPNATGLRTTTGSQSSIQQREK